MTSPQSFPNPGGQPSSSGTEMGPYADVLGVQAEAPKTDSADKLRIQQQQQAGMQVRNLSSQLDGMARQYPAVSQDILTLKRGLTQLLVKIMGSSPSESQPPTGDMG
jgi:hypothetical protein